MWKIFLLIFISSAFARDFRNRTQFPYKCQNGTYGVYNLLYEAHHGGSYLYVPAFPIWAPNGTYYNRPLHFFFFDDLASDALLWQLSYNEIIETNCSNVPQYTDESNALDQYILTNDTTHYYNLINKNEVATDGCNVLQGQMMYFCSNIVYRPKLQHKAIRLANLSAQIHCIEGDFYHIEVFIDGIGQYEHMSFYIDQSLLYETIGSLTIPTNITKNCEDYPKGTHNVPLSYKSLHKAVPISRLHPRRKYTKWEY